MSNDCPHKNQPRATSWRPAPGGAVILRVDGEKLLRATHAAQRIAPDRDQPAGRPEGAGEGGGDQHRLVDRAAHRGDAADLVDGRPDDGEVEPLLAADIAEEHL